MTNTPNPDTSNLHVLMRHCAANHSIQAVPCTHMQVNLFISQPVYVTSVADYCFYAISWVTSVTIRYLWTTAHRNEGTVPLACVVGYRALNFPKNSSQRGGETDVLREKGGQQLKTKTSQALIPMLQDLLYRIAESGRDFIKKSNIFENTVLCCHDKKFFLRT